MYGAGREKLSEVLHVTPFEAKEIIKSFMSKFLQYYIYLYNRGSEGLKMQFSTVVHNLCGCF